MDITKYLIDPKELTTLEKQISVAYMQDSVFNGMIGEGENAPIRSYLEQNAKAGIVRKRIKDLIRGEGVADNTDFKENEDKMKFLLQEFYIRIIGNSLSSEDMRFHELRDYYDFRVQAQESLQDWMRDRMDRAIYSHFTNNCTNIVACDATGGVKNSNVTSAIVTGDIFNTKAIDECVRRAKMGVDGDGNRVPIIRPYRLQTETKDGIKIRLPRYVMLVSPYQSQQLREDSEWRDAQKYAANRGENNYIFTGELGVYNNVIIVEHQLWTREYAGIMHSDITKDDMKPYFAERDQENIHTAGIGQYKGAAGLKTNVALFFGSSALGMPMNEKVTVYTESYDMGRKYKFGIDRLYALGKMKFKGYTDEEKASVYHNKDMGVIACVSAES